MLLEPRFKKTGKLHRFWLKRALKGEFLLLKTVIQSLLISIPVFIIFGGLSTIFLSAFAGMAIGAASLFTPIFGKYRKRVRLEVGSRAAERLSYLYSPEETTELLLPLTTSRSPESRIVAIQGLKGTGTHTAQETLSNLANDKHPLVAAEALESSQEMRQAMLCEGILSVEPLEYFVKEHMHWRKKARSGDALKEYPKPGKKGRKGAASSSSFALVDDPIAKLKETTQSIDEIVYSQMGIRRSFPDVFCKECYARAETQSYMHWDWVRCKHCKDAHHLQSGIAKVTAQIGSDVDWEMKDDQLFIGLWNESKRMARYAEPDELQIIAGQPINYDWAISALVSKLHDENQGYGWQIAVKLIDNPKLETNTLQLLRNLDPSFQAPIEG